MHNITSTAQLFVMLVISALRHELLLPASAAWRGRSPSIPKKARAGMRVS